MNGKNTSLKEVGYEWVAQDDGWQQCKTPPPACTAPRGGLQKCGAHKGAGGFHADDGTPQLDMNKFSNLKGAVAYAHSHGLKADWYFNNCYWCAAPSISLPFMLTAAWACLACSRKAVFDVFTLFWGRFAIAPVFGSIFSADPASAEKCCELQYKCQLFSSIENAERVENSP